MLIDWSLSSLLFVQLVGNIFWSLVSMLSLFSVTL